MPPLPHGVCVVGRRDGCGTDPGRAAHDVVIDREALETRWAIVRPCTPRRDLFNRPAGVPATTTNARNRTASGSGILVGKRSLVQVVVRLLLRPAGERPSRPAKAMATSRRARRVPRLDSPKTTGSKFDESVPQGVDSDIRVVTSESADVVRVRSEEHTSELQSLAYLVCRLLL